MKKNVSAGEAQRLRAFELLLRAFVQSLGDAASSLDVEVSCSARGDLAIRPCSGGFELLVCAGRRAGEDATVLARVPEELHVLEYCGAFVALYREEAQRESPAAFVRRLGIRYVQERIHHDAAGRAALFRRAWERARRTGTRCLARAGSA